jgi:hypothetical protein
VKLCIFAKKNGYYLAKTQSFTPFSIFCVEFCVEFWRDYVLSLFWLAFSGFLWEKT